MKRNYWIMLFSGTTWEQFLGKGARVAGFRERKKNAVSQIHPGDYLIVYLAGITRLAGVMEVKSEYYLDKTPIWEPEDFPCRLKVKLLHRLKPEHAIPITDLGEKLFLFTTFSSSKDWGSLIRNSPVPVSNGDGLLMTKAIRNAARNPIAKEYDEKKYWHSPKKTITF